MSENKWRILKPLTPSYRRAFKSYGHSGLASLLAPLLRTIHQNTIFRVIKCYGNDARMPTDTPGWAALGTLGTAR